MGRIESITAFFFVQYFPWRDHVTVFCMENKGTLCTIPSSPTPLPALSSCNISLSAPPKGAVMLWPLSVVF